MKPMNFTQVQPQMDDADWDSFHDSVYSALFATGQAPLGPIERATLVKVGYMLPESILASVTQWGFGDTVVRGSIFTFVQQEVTTPGALMSSVFQPENC